MLIYLDTNVYCRPFDDQEQRRIRKETDSFEEILDDVKTGKVTLLSSDILLFEVSKILSPVRKTEVEKYIALCKKHVNQDEKIKELAVTFREKCGIMDRDALHLASAIAGEGKYFLSCDDEITGEKSEKCIEMLAEKYGSRIKVLNPIDFRTGD